MADADRKRLSELFRDALEDGDVVTAPDVLTHDSPVPALLPTPEYQGAGVAAPASSSTTTVVLVALVVLLLGVVAYLMWTSSSKSAPMGTTRTDPSPELDDDGAEDTEVSEITERAVRVEHDTEDPDPAATRVGRGAPHMSQLRPTHFQAPSAATTQKKKKHAASSEDAGDAQDDPMFQSIDLDDD